MDCWHCQAPLVWSSDIDSEDHHNAAIVTFLSCSECPALVEVFLPLGEEDEN